MRVFMLALVVVLAACDTPTIAGVQAPTNPPPPDDPPIVAEKSRVVVAVVDTAFNPYHDFFYKGAASSIYGEKAPSSVTPEVLGEFGVPPENIIELTRTGNIARDIQTDARIWKTIRPGTPYWFKGTNIIGVSFAAKDDNRLVPDPEKDPHGVATSAAVLAANPDAVVVVVETWDDLANEQALKYALLHPSVDIVSLSVGYCLPVVCTASWPAPATFPHTYDSVVKMGKLFIQSAGNNPNFTPMTGGPGNWWTIGVSGVGEHGSSGQTLLAGDVSDFVSDYHQELPYCQDCEDALSVVAGTSFSCPRSAGVASSVLLATRTLFKHQGGIQIIDDSPVMATDGSKAINAWQLRRALEEAAYVDYAVADYDPVAGIYELGSLPVNEAAPWLQLGWGDLSADPGKSVVSEALAQLGFGTAARQKPPGFCDYQAEHMRFRQSYWDALAESYGTDEVVPNPNPYIFCDSNSS